jgi:hypothetical protein
MSRPEVTGRAPRVTAVTSRRSAPAADSASDEPDADEDEEPAPARAAIEPVNPDDATVIPASRVPRARGPPNRLALSVAEFCELHSISIGFFYALLKRGEGPRVMRSGLRTLVSVEEAKRWREARTAATAGN